MSYDLEMCHSSTTGREVGAYVGLSVSSAVTGIKSCVELRFGVVGLFIFKLVPVVVYTRREQIGRRG
jgi:hypothetical protein